VVGCAVVVVKVSNTKAKEGEVKGEKQAEECDSGLQGAKEEQEGKYEPALGVDPRISLKLQGTMGL
jgi:hypothetical protein